MKAEIISVGTELLLGHTINSDASIVALALAELGFDLLNIQTVGDNPGRLEEALRLAARRSEIIITTGGLGPTDDDLTRNVVAAFAGAELVEDQASLNRLKEYFGSRPMSSNQLKQALAPKNSVVFPNHVGTAPGFAVQLPNGGCVIMLPGPPAELRKMLETGVKPYLERLSGGIIHSTLIKTFGIGEGAAAERIADLMESPNPTVAPYAHGGEMFVKVTAKADCLELARKSCGPIVREVMERLGDVVYGIDVASLEAALVAELAKQGKTVATAESCTGGLIAKRITDQPGASAVFQLGAITYANSAKEKILGVCKELLNEYGAVSEEVARAMAFGIRQVSGSDFGIGVTGIAGPEGGSETKPLGLVYIALAAGDKCFMRVMRPQGRYMGRQWVRERAASHALDMLRRYLAGIPIDLD